MFDLCVIFFEQLQWNMIRLGGAEDLCDSLCLCSTLEVLDLSYNALGRKASTILGHAIMVNKVREERREFEKSCIGGLISIQHFLS